MDRSSFKFLTVMGLLAACSLDQPHSRPYGASPPGREAQSSVDAAPTLVTTSHTISQGSSIYNVLKQAGVSSSTILDWVRVGKEVVSLKDIKPGANFKLTWDSEEKSTVKEFELRYAADSSLIIRKSNLEWTAEKISHPITITQKTFHGIVDSSLWESAEIVGVDASLITSLAEVFAWQIDFNRAVKRGDRWRLTVEQKYVDDQAIGWGHIIAAEYENDGQVYTGIRFPQNSEHAAYYAPNGQSLKRMFLKSPIKFGRITSGFSHNRFHPVLGKNRPHHGVDYGAPKGTPVMAVGKGTVEFAAYNGGSGKMVKIRHNAVYSTAYLHLSGFAPGIRPNSSVEQGQIIGYVGSTGLSTGPHLHFSFYENGVFRDPIGIRFPSADPISTKDMPEFQKAVASTLRLLPDWQIATNREEQAPSARYPSVISPQSQEKLFH